MKTLAARIIRTFGFRNMMTVNAVVSAVFLAACALFTASTPLLLILIILVVGGFFRSLQFTAINTVAYAEVEPSQMSRATTLVSVNQQLAVSAGVAVGAASVETTLWWHHATELTADVFAPAFVVVSLISAASAYFFWQMPDDAGHEISGRKAIAISSRKGAEKVAATAASETTEDAREPEAGIGAGAKARLIRRAERPQAIGHLRPRLVPAMSSPNRAACRARWCRGYPAARRARPGAEPPPHVHQDGLVQRSTVRMVAFGVVAIRILAGVEQKANGLRLSVLRSQGERAMAGFGVRKGKQTRDIVHEAQSGGGRQLDPRSAFRQGLGGVDHPERQGSEQRRSPFSRAASFDRGAEIQQQLDKRRLESCLGRMAA